MSSALLCPKEGSGLFSEEGEKAVVSLRHEWAPLTNTGVLTVFDFLHSEASYLGCINFASGLVCYLTAEPSISLEYLNDCALYSDTFYDRDLLVFSHWGTEAI